jgi:hypothetical protein
VNSTRAGWHAILNDEHSTRFVLPPRGASFRATGLVAISSLVARLWSVVEITPWAPDQRQLQLAETSDQLWRLIGPLKVAFPKIGKKHNNKVEARAAVGGPG